MGIHEQKYQVLISSTLYNSRKQFYNKHNSNTSSDGDSMVLIKHIQEKHKRSYAKIKVQ